MSYLYPLSLLAVVLLVLVVVGLIPTALRSLRWFRNRSAPELQSEARVVDKRTQLTRTGGNPDQRYYVTFQFPTGARLELQVPPSEAGILVVGDAGRLDWRGTRYLGFTREILR